MDAFLTLQVILDASVQLPADAKDKLDQAAADLIARIEKHQNPDGAGRGVQLAAAGPRAGVPGVGDGLVRGIEGGSGGDLQGRALRDEPPGGTRRMEAQRPLAKARRRRPASARRRRGPASFATYLMAARLEVISQADRTNQIYEPAARKRWKEAKTPEQLRRGMREVGSIQANCDTLVRARKDMLAALPESQSAAPLLFFGEDFLSSWLIVDGLGPAAPRQCMTATAAHLLTWQKRDGSFNLTDGSDEQLFCTAAAALTLEQTQRITLRTEQR